MIKRVSLLLTIIAVSIAASSQTITNHTVKRGETLESIARDYDTTVDKIKELNPYVKEAYVTYHLKVPKKPKKEVVYTETTTTQTVKNKRSYSGGNRVNWGNVILDALGALFSPRPTVSTPYYTPMTTVPTPYPIYNPTNLPALPPMPNIYGSDPETLHKRALQYVNDAADKFESDKQKEEERFKTDFRKKYSREPSKSEVADHIFTWSENKIRASAQRNQEMYNSMMNSSSTTSSSSSSDTRSESQPVYKEVTTTTYCLNCNGSGKCKYCNGKGWVVRLGLGADGPCPVCHNHDGRCTLCNGSGKKN